MHLLSAQFAGSMEAVREGGCLAEPGLVLIMKVGALTR
jgi:hypothetical protein